MVRRNFLATIVSLVMSANLCFALTNQSPQTGEKNPQKDLTREAAGIYNTLSSLPEKDRKTIYQGLSPEIRSELWRT